MKFIYLDHDQPFSEKVLDAYNIYRKMVEVRIKYRTLQNEYDNTWMNFTEQEKAELIRLINTNE